MADKKISALTGATTPLVGTEVLPIVQGGSTVKVSVSELTTGRAVDSAGGTFTDNLIQGTAAKGVNFTANTPAAGMTNQLLNSYEEGTWAPAFGWFGTPSTGIAYTSTGTYTKVGRMVQVYGKVILSNKGSDTGMASITNVPFSGTFVSIVDPITAFVGLVAGGAIFTLAAGPSVLFFAQQTTTARIPMEDTSFNPTTQFEFYGTFSV